MSVVHLDPNTYALKPLEAVAQIVKAPDFLVDPNDALTQYLVDHLIRPSAANSTLVADATVLISQAQMGVTLFKQQRDTCRLLAAFVYKMLVPDEGVPLGTKFEKRYRITDQREAQDGTYDTVVNGVQTREYSQVFHLSSKVVTMTFGGLIGVTVPSKAYQEIKREFDMASTSWDLHKTIAVLAYATAQPTMTDRVARKTKGSSRAERLDSVLVTAELLCGVVNLQPETFACVLENARRILGSDKPEVVIVGDSLFRVISQKSSNGMGHRIVSEVTKISPEFSVYTMANETYRGKDSYDFTMCEVTRSSLSHKDLPFISESSFRDNPFDMNVNYVRLGGGPEDKIPIVHVDAVQMEHGKENDTSTEHKAFCNTRGFKMEYATVGCMPPAMKQINPSHVLSTGDTDEMSYKQFAQRSPCVSYMHQYDGSVAAVTLRSLHPVGNPKELFSKERRARLQSDVNALMRGDPNAIPVDSLSLLARNRDWYQKIKNPASVLEFDAREMVVPRPQQVPAGNGVERWIVRPRVALFNSSSMNDIEGEITQIGSELLTVFGDGEHAKDLARNLTFLERALHYANGLESAIKVRLSILEGTQSAELSKEWTKGRSFWSWITDPICAVYIRKFLAAKECADTITPHERTVLIQLEELFNSLIGLFKGVVGKRGNSVIAVMPTFFAPENGNALTERGYPTAFTADDVDYCNLMYWIILPVLGARVYRHGGSMGDVTPEKFLLQYAGEECNLTSDLNLTPDCALSVARLRGRCVFSKAAPPSGTWVDVTEHFEPTASKHKLSRDTGFSETSVVTYMWAIRLQKLTEISNSLAKVLLGIHYSTLLTHKVIREHYDTKYYSGLSYLVFRGVRFTGCGVALMQQKSALYTLGAQVVCKPTAHNTHQVKTVVQCCESVVIPETLESPGVYIPNMYMKDVRGGDVHVNTGGPFDLVVADAFNGFCPESDSACGYRRPYIFTAGRSERLNGAVTRDTLMRAEAYTCMPTLLQPFSSALWARNKYVRQRSGEESNHKIFCNALHMAEFEKGVLDPIGDPFKDTVERVNGTKLATEVMQSILGVAFCATYGIGLTSDKKLMCASDPTGEAMVDRLAPRISGTGIFANNPIQSTHRLISPVFNRIFESTKYSRVLRR